MLIKAIELTINDLPVDYDTLEARYFEAYKTVHENLNMTIEEFRGSNIYNIFNTCILIDMVNNQFLSNFVPSIVANSIKQNEIQAITYSGNTSFYLIQEIKKIDNVKEAQIIDINSDLVGTAKGNIRIFIKRSNEENDLNDIDVGDTVYNNLNEGVVSLGNRSITISRAGFEKIIQYSYSNDVDCTLTIEASPNNLWNGDLYDNEALVSMIYDYWVEYYSMQKEVQPQVFLRKMEMLANITFVFNYNGNKTEDFVATNGDYLVLTKASITLTVG